MTAAIGILIFMAGWNLSLWHLYSPEHQVFDEIRYVSAARQFISGGINENWSHPPLAKALIAVGVAVVGDNSVGWRIMSTIFGAITLVIMYGWGLIFFSRQREAVSVAFLTAFNCVHFLQSRVATLDVFMFTFIALGLALFTWLWLKSDLRSVRKTLFILFAIGICFGLGMACKWFALIPYLLCFALFLLRPVLSFKRRALLASVGFVAMPLLIYFSTSGILLRMVHPRPTVHAESQSGGEKYSALDLIQLQWKMIVAQSSYDGTRHVFFSQWYTWPWMLYPNWYDIETREVDSQEQRAGLAFVGNPLILWTGFLAVVFCAFHGVRNKSREALLIAVFFAALWLSWAIIPRHGGFSYYYYPAAMILSFALVEAARRIRLPRWACLVYLMCSALGFYFLYPLISDQFLPTPQFKQRLLLPTWQ
jgi:dolichyl-phosphate-mannose-protein mannosyltransferase